MKNILLIFCFTLFTFYVCKAQTTLILEPYQSMIMTGKGPGQDATVNAYFGQECYAIIKNIGEKKFSIRVQHKGEIVLEISILKGDVKKLKLLKDYELYLDPNSIGISEASITYEKLKG